MQTIFPILRYTDARAAIQWLCTAFGFREIFSVPETGQFVRHAQLSLGTSLIMLGSSRADETGMKSPRTLGGVTQALCVYVPDLDAHFERARLAGAAITGPPQDTDFGFREYHVLDPEGHIWIFGTYLPSTYAPNEGLQLTGMR